MIFNMFSKFSKKLNPISKRYFTNTLNPEFYKSKKIFDLEIKKIFNRNWIPIGYTNELNNNTILAKKFGNVEVFITKTKQGEIKTFYNTCRHRASRLIKNDCNKKAIICPYHLWKYSLDGKLLSTPRFNCPNFNKEENGLYEIKTSAFRNIICINFDNNCGDIYEHFGDVTDDIKNYPLEDCKIVRYKRYEINANWKTLQDNFLEYYHLPSIHPILVKSSGMNQHSYTSRGKKGKYIGYKTDPITNCNAPIEPKYMDIFPNLTDYEKQMAHFQTLFPNMFYFLLPNHFFSIIIEPISETKTIEHATLLVHNNQNEDSEQIELIWKYWDRVNQEDVNICEEVQKGMYCQHYKTGVYVPQYEKNVEVFHDMINTCLQS